MASSTQYTKALFEITEELGTTERVLAELKAAESLFKSSPEYPKLLDTPAVSKEERVGLVDTTNCRAYAKSCGRIQSRRGSGTRGEFLRGEM